MWYNLFSRLYASVDICEPTIGRKQYFQKSCEIGCHRYGEIRLWLKNHIFPVTFRPRYKRSNLYTLMFPYVEPYRREVNVPKFLHEWLHLINVRVLCVKESIKLGHIGVGKSVFV